MPDLLDQLCWRDVDHPGSGPSAPEQLIDVENGYAVLDFAYRYLETCSRPPNDNEVHNVTATVARYKGPRLVPWSTLESLLAGLPVEHA